MKHIKLYEGFAHKINESDEDSSGAGELLDDVENFLDNSVNIKVSLYDLFQDTDLMILMKNGELYEKSEGHHRFINCYESEEEYESETGESLDKKYKAYPDIINLFDMVDDNLKDNIEMVYVHYSFFYDKVLEYILSRI
jgi:hypothetical protein